MKKFTDQEIKNAIERAPRPIQEELAAGYSTADTIASIGKEFNLHIDVIGMIAELNRNMLLGLTSPQEFLQELIAAGVSDATAREIISEINHKIFIPLRDQMRSGGSVPPPSNPAASAPSVPRYAPPPVRPTPTNASVQQAAVLPPSAPVSQSPVSAVSAPASPMEAVRLATPPANPPLSSAPRPYSVDPYREPTDEGGQ